mgnify:CR=1 FL=1
MMMSIWTNEELALLDKHFALAGAEQCARIIGRAKRGIVQKARERGLCGPSRRADCPERMAEILKNAKRPDGIRALDLGDWHKVASMMMIRMEKAGKLHKAQISYRNVRYFANKADAQAATDRIRTAVPVRIARPVHSAWWPKDAEPIITAQTKYTSCPAPGRVLHTSTYED